MATSPIVPKGFVIDSNLPPGFQLDKKVIEPSYLDLAKTVVGGAIAQPVAGLAGLGRMGNEVIQNPSQTGGTAGDVVRRVQGQLTPDLTPEGKAALQAIADKIPDSVIKFGTSVAEGYDAIANWAAEHIGPVAGAAVKMAPTVALEYLGLRGGKSILSRSKAADKAISKSLIRRGIRESAPSIDDLKAGARAVYNELDNSGAVIKPNRYQSLVDDITKAAMKSGLDKDITPKGMAAIRRLNERAGESVTLTELDTLRKVAQGAARSIDPPDAQIGALITEHIDDFLDGLNAGSLSSGQISNIGPKYRVARELWGRARRSEMIQQAFEKARNQASGFENGIRVQFRSILNNPKKAKMFSQEELTLMKGVVQGSKGQNLAKLIGRLGFSEQGATNLVGGTIGATGGGLLFGTPGAVAVPVIGTVSRRFAQRLTRKSAEFLDEVIRAGRDGKAIVMAYYKNTPKGQRNPVELSQLLSRPDVVLPTSQLEEVQQAVTLAQKAREIAQVGAGALPAVQQPIKGELGTQ